MSSVSRSVGRPVSRSVLSGQLNTLASIIKSLFANNEQGFAYDPNDLSTMFQDAAGTIPVTAAGQPVGLMLDKSGRNNHAFQNDSGKRPLLKQTPILGNELVASGGFSNGTAYPFDDFTISNGGFSAKTNTSKIGGAVSNTVLNVTAGLTYAIAFDLISSLGGRALSVRLVDNKSGAGPGSHSGINTSKLGNNIINYTPSVSGSVYLQFNNGGAAICDYRVENISMKEITGYRTDQNYIEYDKVDDKLTTTLPAQLTGCTVVRAVPNVGTQILMNQTIPTPYNDNTDHCGLIVINRALTASETSQITKLFNKAAGV